jgi:hypothetical protein
MPQATTLTPESRFIALFVGPKHSGKTCAACSWRTNKRIKVLDGDGRIRGLLGAPWIDRSQIDYSYFPPHDTLKFFERVNKDLDALELQSKIPGQNFYETFVCDSLTSFCANLISDSLPLTHADGKGKHIGNMSMAGPEDYGFESTGVSQFLAGLRSLPLNLIVTAHIVPKYDKPLIQTSSGRTIKDSYAESIQIGEKLSLRDKIGANSMIYFDHIFRFDRRIVNNEERFFVEYISDIACTSFPGLKPGVHDITGKDFRSYTLNLLHKGEPKE